MILDRDLLGLMAALGIGLLVGGERERRKGEGAARAAAGIRTFVMAALIGATSVTVGGAVALAAGIGSVMVLAAVAYVRSDRTDPGLTTELALILMVPLGALAMREPALAAAAAVVVAIILAARGPLHHFVKEALTQSEVRSALTFTAATLVVLPVIPDRAIGPFDALNLHTLWLIVIMMMAVSAAGYIAVRTLGAGIGLPLSGLAAGFISSAATIAAMGARAQATPALLGPAVAGAVLSTVATIAQLVLLLSVASPPTLLAMAVPLAAAGIAAAFYAAFFMADALAGPRTADAQPGDAFDLGTALKLASLIAVVLVASAALKAVWGNTGLLIAAGIAGLADAHAPAVSVAGLVASNSMPVSDAVPPILLAMATNTLTKCVLAYTSGGLAFARRVVPGLALVIAAAWLGAGLR